jgi:hypothetical protein
LGKGEKKQGAFIMPRFSLLILAVCLCLLPLVAQSDDKKPASKEAEIRVDQAKRLVRLDAKIAPRKINDPRYKQIYPIEVVACWPFPRGQKAHETVVTIEALPSKVHKALVALGLKPGRPVLGESKQPPQGPECKIFLEIAEAGSVRKVPLDRTLVDKRTGKPFPKSVRWLFTGSVMTKPDPNSPKLVYGADLTGTLITIFPVTDQCVFQSNLAMKYEHLMQLETNPRVLPKIGTPVQLVIEAPRAK